MKKADAIVILTVLLLALPAALVWYAPFARGTARTAVVIRDDAVLARIPLDGPGGDYAYGENGQIVIRVEDGRARFAASDCPDGLCVRSGWLERPGRVAACLPNRCVLRIEGEGEYDVILGPPPVRRPRGVL
ncbi:MAG: NusG domain II-containing protein [Oscillospiraceae bacterium]|nr:NusG domain II-containing protein [Oscillospiraceae bacterium]